MIIGVILFVTFFKFFVKKEDNADKVVRFHTAANYLQFFAELSLCMIFYER